MRSSVRAQLLMHTIGLLASLELSRPYSCTHMISHKVYNCYGELSNDVLLKKYGFCPLENPFSYVTLDKAMVVDFLWDCKGGSVSQKHPLRDLYDRILDQTSLLDEDEEPFMIHPNGHVNVALFALLRMIIDGSSTAPDDDQNNGASDLLDNPWIVGAMTKGVAVPVADALVPKRLKGRTSRWVEKCRTALRLACERRLEALTRDINGRGCRSGRAVGDGQDDRDDGGDRADLEGARCLLASEQSILSDLLKTVEVL